MEQNPYESPQEAASPTKQSSEVVRHRALLSLLFVLIACCGIVYLVSSLMSIFVYGNGRLLIPGDNFVIIACSLWILFFITLAFLLRRIRF